MIYSRLDRDFQQTVFAFDVDDNFYSYFPEDHYAPQGAEGWLRHNANRIYLRLYVFIDSVLERHNNGQMGFRDPIVIWGNYKKGTFNIHPGLNRVVLKMLLPEVRMVGWVVDSTCDSRDDYKHIFSNIQPIQRDEHGNRKILWISHHRTDRMNQYTGKEQEDQYDFALNTDIYLGNKSYDTELRKDKWKELQKTRGFGCFIRPHHHLVDIGTPQANYLIKGVPGVYQAFLHHFFDYPFSKWEKLYLEELK